MWNRVFKHGTLQSSDLPFKAWPHAVGSLAFWSTRPAQRAESTCQQDNDTELKKAIRETADVQAKDMAVSKRKKGTIRKQSPTQASGDTALQDLQNFQTLHTKDQDLCRGAAARRQIQWRRYTSLAKFSWSMTWSSRNQLAITSSCGRLKKRQKERNMSRTRKNLEMEDQSSVCEISCQNGLHSKWQRKRNK